MRTYQLRSATGEVATITLDGARWSLRGADGPAQEFTAPTAANAEAAIVEMLRKLIGWSIEAAFEDGRPLAEPYLPAAPDLDRDWMTVGANPEDFTEVVVDCPEDADDLRGEVSIAKLLGDRRLAATKRLHLAGWSVGGTLDFRPWLKALRKRTPPALQELTLGFGSGPYEDARLGSIESWLWQQAPTLETFAAAGIVDGIERFEARALEHLQLWANPLDERSATALLASTFPALASLDLDFDLLGEHGGLSPRCLRAFCSRHDLPALRTLKLAGIASGTELVHQLLDAPWFGQLTTLRLLSPGSDQDRASVRGALDRLRGIGSLTLSRALVGDLSAELPHAQLVER